MSSSYTSAILNKLYEGRRLSLLFLSERDRENTRKALYNFKRSQDAVLKVLLEEDRKVLRFIKEPVGIDQKVRATVWLEQPTVVFSFVLLEDEIAELDQLSIDKALEAEAEAEAEEKDAK